jgi:hypothetical protein
VHARTEYYVEIFEGEGIAPAVPIVHSGHKYSLRFLLHDYTFTLEETGAKTARYSLQCDAVAAGELGLFDGDWQASLQKRDYVFPFLLLFMAVMCSQPGAWN